MYCWCETHQVTKWQSQNKVILQSRIDIQKMYILKWEFAAQNPTLVPSDFLPATA